MTAARLKLDASDLIPRAVATAYTPPPIEPDTRRAAACASGDKPTPPTPPTPPPSGPAYPPLPTETETRDGKGGQTK